MDSTFKKQPTGFATKAIHVGQEPEQWTSRAVIPPISLSTTFKQDAPGEHKGFDYSRSGNPTRSVLEKCLASLDNAKYGLTFSSGIGATTALLTMFKSGAHIIVGDDVYGGTARVIRHVASNMDMTVSFVDQTNLQAFKSEIRENTKLVFIESPTNPLMKVADIEALSKLCHQHGNIIVAIDNTFLTPYFQRPLELGADIAFYSLTKYMNGHNDVVMGGMTMNSEELYKKLNFLQYATGVVPSPFDCYQVNRGLKTLSIRMKQHQENSIEVAKFLETHPFVERVLHPALPSHPQHKITLKQTYGHSGIFSFYLKGNYKNSKAFLNALKMIMLAASLGGYVSTIALPTIMTHAAVPIEEREKLGITDSLIRFSVGLEDVKDIISDLEAALSAAQKIKCNEF